MNPEVRTPGYAIELARKLRLEMTRAETLLWKRIRNRQLEGYRFRNQHPVYRYILDFYCAEARFAIEIDGSVHGQRKEYDEYRDKILANLDIETMRVKDTEIEENIEAVLIRIANRLKARQSGNTRDEKKQDVL